MNKNTTKKKGAFKVPKSFTQFQIIISQKDKETKKTKKDENNGIH